MKVLIEFENNPLYFEQPQKVISCKRVIEINSCFKQIETELTKGNYLAGFFSFELGYVLEEKLLYKKGYDFPIIHFGVYTNPVKHKPKPFRKTRQSLEYLKIITTNICKENYYGNIDKIRSYIESGDVYQITYCMKFNLTHGDDKYSLYCDLFNVQPVPYPAYIETEDFKILSLSPELFIKKIGNRIITKPMKGTWFREGIINNLFGGFLLRYDPKNRAENVMITDLLRNDLGRIGYNIKVPKLFEVDRYRTLFQMTSTVTANIDRNIPIIKLFKALHPSGSVTGAPKIRAMQIIREIEKEERKIYTGAIGYIAPNKDMFFNVPIRTLLFYNEKGEMGVGGGIVWDSTPKGEWQECMTKARFIFNKQ